MKVSAENPEILEARHSTARLPLADHPLDCPTWAQCGTCRLRELVEPLGIRERVLRPMIREAKIDDPNACYAIDTSKCIPCGLRVRACVEARRLGAVDLVKRGYASAVEPFGGGAIKDSICESRGESAERCPAGAGRASPFGSGAMTNSADDLLNAEVILVTGSNTTENHSIIGLKIREAAEKRVAAHTPERVAEITGAPAELMVEAARLYATAERASIVYSMGITQHATGVDNVPSPANLAMITGQIGRPGTGVNPLRGQGNVQGACDMGENQALSDDLRIDSRGR